MSANDRFALEIIEPSERKSSNWDMFATWVAANANNGTWFIGGVIAACGFGGAVAHLTWSSVVAYLTLAGIGYIGYKVGATTMGAARASFGIRGSWVPSVMNMVMYIGWTAVNTFIAATSVSILLNELLGWPVWGQPGGEKGIVVGIIVMSVLHLLSVSTGANSVRVIERVGVVLVFVFAIWETIAVFQQVSFSEILAWTPPADDAMASGVAVDKLAAFNLGWVTCAADFTRFAKRPEGSHVIPFVGAFVGVFWFAMVGLVATISIAITSGTYDANNSDPSTIASKLGLGAVALIVVILTSMTANAVNLMAAGSSLTNIATRLRLTPALWIVTLAACLVTFVPLVIGSFLDSFTLFLDYIGCALGPVTAIMLTDFFLRNHAEYSRGDLTAEGGRFWYRSGVNWIALGCWLLGVALYVALGRVPFLTATVGATFPNMLVIAAVYYALMRAVHGAPAQA
ncbi:purine-cytosine transport protein [Bifidobacterium sp. DSM 109958]|uniref:Purine-cytosine transport protein n=1 Tax=Bifidobacterium moraviense TaxID=2675323 RepID=A0A7Y0F0W5_9BIFI|nr:cytosine permease [Bifidobacterium sp. DSM 109958]NMM99968.1 purine-cytosine transport protein [Bifidobacterium sp. DSM 109958]